MANELKDTTEEREAFGAWWDGNQWRPYTTVEPYPTRAARPWPPGVTAADLPTPRFQAGQRIRFKWDRGYLEGVVEGITTMFNRHDGRRCVHYDVREIGHRRSVYDYGDSDISLAKGRTDGK